MSKFKCRRILSLLSAAAMVVTLLPSTVIAADDYLTYGDFSYKVVEVGAARTKMVFIYAYNGNDANVVIPSEIDGYSVHELVDNCFKDNTTLESVTIPSSVIWLGNSAFAGCTNLKDVNIEEGLVNIGANAFEGCGIEEIVLPSTVRSMKGYIFKDTPLSDITMPAALEDFTEGIFYNCDSLTEIDFSPCVKLGTIGSKTFQGCDNLTKITLGEKQKSIGSYALADCKSLTDYSFLSQFTSYGNYALANMPLTEYTFPEGTVTIPREVFENTPVKKVTLPDTVKTLGDYSFYCCKTLEEIVGGEGVETIGSYAFTDTGSGYIHTDESTCVHIRSLGDIGKNVKTIGKRAFVNCMFLEEFDLSQSKLVSIGERAFANCKSLKEIVLPSTASSIELEAFLKCTSLEKAYLNFELTYLAMAAFDGCSSLSEITYPGCLDPTATYQGDNTFRGCKNLKKVVVPEGTVDLVPYAFYGSEGIEEIVLPSTLKTIGMSAFDDCINLRALNIPEGIETIDCAFYNNPKLENVVIPDTALCELDTFYDGAPDYAVTTHPYSNQAAGLLSKGIRFYRSDATDFIATNTYFKNSTYELAQPMSESGVVCVELNVDGSFESDSDEIYDVSITYPDNYEVVEGSVMVNGEPAEDAEIYGNYIYLSHYDGNFEEIFADCSFTVEAQFKRIGAPDVDYLAEFDSVAILGTSGEEAVIDFIYAREPVVSLDALSTGYSTVEVFGYYLPQTEVDIYVDGEYVDSVMTNKAGRYSLELELGDENTVFEIEAVASDDNEKKSSKIYDIEAVSLEEFIVSIDVSDDNFAFGYDYDLLDDKKDIITIYPQLEDYQKTFDFEFDLYGNTSRYSNISVVAKVAEGEIEEEAYWDSQKRRYVADFMYYIYFNEIVPEEIMIRCETIDGDIECFYPVIQPSWIIDPSGYVYAGVTSDRLEGVKAEAYFVEYDGSGDFWSEEPSDNDAILWDAENYNQTNPVYSDGLGQYGWDVPQGWWKIKYTLDGYQTAWSDWLKVAPAQLQVNINMLSTATPEIVDFAFTENGAVVEFDMFMDTDSLENVVLKDRNGNPLEYTVSYPLSDTSYEGTVYSKTFTFVTDEVAYSADVPAEVTSYAGVAVTADSFENENAVMLGDLNENGEVDLRDVVLLYQLFSGCEVDVNPVAADVNCSGQPDIRDVVLLYQAFSGWEVTLGGNTLN